MDKNNLQQTYPLVKRFSITQMKDVIKTIFAQGRAALSRNELAGILLRLAESVADSDKFLTYVERRGPAIYFRMSNAIGETFELTGGTLLRGTTNLYFAALGGATPQAAGWSPVNDDWAATPATIGYLSSNAALVDTDTGKIFQYQYNGLYSTYNASAWVLVYTPPVTNVFETITGSIAASATESINVGSGKLVSHITFIKTDATASPTLTVEIQGGATLLSASPWDESDSTVWAASYMRNGATILDIVPNCACDYVVYIAI